MHLFGPDNLYKNKCYAYIMSKENSIDIDDEMDFLLAELYLSNRGASLSISGCGKS